MQEPHELDWSRHHPATHEKEIGPGLFLADFVQMLGSRLIASWHGSETRHVRTRPRQIADFPDETVAFTDAEPVAAIHEAYGPVVRSVLSTSAWRDRILERRLRDAWVHGRAMDNANGGPTGRNETIGMPDGLGHDPITRDHWATAWEEGIMAQAIREGSTEALSKVGFAIATMAMSGDTGDGSTSEKIVVLMRRDGTAERDAMPPEAWNVGPEVRMQRIATCAITEGDPCHDGHDRILFVDREGLEAAVASYADRNFDDCMPDDDWLAAVTARERTPRHPQLYADIRRFLEEALRDPKNRGWRLPKLKMEVAAKFGFNLDGMTETIRDDLAQMDEFGFLRFGGRPRNEPEG